MSDISLVVNVVCGDEIPCLISVGAPTNAHMTNARKTNGEKRQKLTTGVFFNLLLLLFLIENRDNC